MLSCRVEDVKLILVMGRTESVKSVKSSHDFGITSGATSGILTSSKTHQPLFV
jgi:hypothetical protein